MTIRERLRNIGQALTNRQESIEVVEKQTFSDILGGVLDNSINRLSDQKTISTKLLEANKGWVYRNNDVIAKEVATIDFVLYRMAINKGEIIFNEIDDHELLDLLDRFNPSTTKQDAIYSTQSHKKLTGDAFWYLDSNGQKIDNIFILQPDKIELKLGDPTDATAELVEGYHFKDVINNNVVEHDYEPDEIIHFKTPNPSNMFRGYGAVEAAADTIDLDNLTNLATRRFFEQGAITNFVLSTEAKLTEDQLKRLRAELRAAYAGINKAYQTMILGAGLKPEKISFSNREMEFLAQLEWYRDKLMVLFGNTKASLGIIDDVNRASHESSIIAWKRNAVKPDMQAICDTLNEFLVPRYGENLLLGFEDPIPEDRNAKLEEAKVVAEHDIMTANEIREMLGYDPIEGEAANQLRRDRPQPAFDIPEPLKQINLKAVLRKRNIYKIKQLSQDMRSVAIPIAKEILRRRKIKSVTEVREHEQFTNERVWDYWKKQIHIVEVIEKRFENAVTQFLIKLEATVLERVDAEVAQRKSVVKDLYNEDELIVRAELDFTPILMEQVVAAGQQAYKLIGVDDPYLPYKIRDAVRKNVRKFARSMLDTDQDKLTDILTNGIKEGLSVPQIKTQITEAFDVIKRNQAATITRTEVIKVSNMAAEDAWVQSGVVEAKQWLTAEDDRVEEACAEMNGKIVDLGDAYFDKGDEFMGMIFDYGAVEEPPLHPNCRCVLLPVLINQKAYLPIPISQKEMLEDQILELEAKIDKRTKAYRELKAKNLDDTAYIHILEKMAGIEGNDGGSGG